MQTLRVGANSNPNAVAGALAAVLREYGGGELETIGAGALNQATKAVAICRGFVAPAGIDLICIPAFSETMVKGELKTCIRLIVEPR